MAAFAPRTGSRYALVNPRSTVSASISRAIDASYVRRLRSTVTDFVGSSTLDVEVLGVHADQQSSFRRGLPYRCSTHARRRLPGRL